MSVLSIISSKPCLEALNDGGKPKLLLTRMVSVLKRAKAAMEEVFCEGSYSKVLQRTLYYQHLPVYYCGSVVCVFKMCFQYSCFPLILVLVHSLSPI